MSVKGIETFNAKISILAVSDLIIKGLFAIGKNDFLFAIESFFCVFWSKLNFFQLFRG